VITPTTGKYHEGHLVCNIEITIIHIGKTGAGK
jgi:hypothetical protein